MNRLQGLRSRHWAFAGMIAIVLCGLGMAADWRAFFACWLAAWWTCAGALLGAQANLWLHDLTGGAWGLPLRPIWRRLASALPMLLILMLPLAAAAWLFYPWSQAGWMPQSAHPAFKTAWLSPAFVTARLAAYAGLWLACARVHRNTHGKGAGGLRLIIYGLTVSLAGVDLILSLMPQWYSSGFGLVVVAMQMKLGFALGVSGASRAPPSASAPAFQPELGRDWGNLLLMYVLMWAYLAYVQFLIIWAENLPDEIAWYLPRLDTGWVWLGGILVAADFFAPLILLLFRPIKQDRRCLLTLAVALCVLGWLESIWITLPSVPGLSWHALWMAPMALAGMACLLWAFAMRRKNQEPLRRMSPAMPGQGVRQ